MEEGHFCRITVGLICWELRECVMQAEVCHVLIHVLQCVFYGFNVLYNKPEGDLDLANTTNSVYQIHSTVTMVLCYSVCV